ncbi:CASP-like protein 3A1 [Euphorbia lathyris]|uniref:CASP-like protein 3A1 n=1 Tax=Euphorbia lathyris TaxID=212925 RepID=UPI0033131A92
MMMNGEKTPPPEVVVHLPESKVAATENSGTMSGPLVGVAAAQPLGRNADVIHVTLRLVCLVTSVVSLSFMVTARQDSKISIYGFMLPVHSKWSFSHSFEYLVGIAAAVAAHSLLQIIISTPRLLNKSPVIPSTTHAWLLFAGDQVFAYAMIGAGAAASGVSNLNRTGIQHTALPNFCKPLHYFCDHVAVSIALTFLSGFLLAALAVEEVIWLSRSNY